MSYQKYLALALCICSCLFWPLAIAMVRPIGHRNKNNNNNNNRKNHKKGGWSRGRALKWFTHRHNTQKYFKENKTATFNECTKTTVAQHNKKERKKEKERKNEQMKKEKKKNMLLDIA